MTFKNPLIDFASKAIWTNIPKSVKAGRTLMATIAVTDKWNNPVKEDSDNGDQSVAVTSSRGFVNLVQPVDKAPSTFQVQVLLSPLDRGRVDLNFSYHEGDIDLAGDDIFRASKSFWSGPAVNATAGAKKGRVIVEAYRSVGQTVNVFVGSTKVASFVPDAANDRFVVKGIKSGNRKVSVKVTPGYDFAGVIAVK